MHRKLDIAYEYLVAAVELYYQGRYFPALTLAGAAEEIFEAVMNSRNQRPSIGGPSSLAPRLRRVGSYVPISSQIIAIVRALSREFRHLSDGDIRTKLNRAKNSAKHGTARDRRTADLTIEADAELESYYIIARALENYMRLHYEPTGELLRFYREYLAGRKTAHHEGSTVGPA